MAPPLKLPPGATLVSDGSSGAPNNSAQMPLPPGAALVSGGDGTTGAPPDAAKSWSDKLGFTNPVARGATDLAEGLAAGVNSTIYHGGDLIRRATGTPRIINDPEVQQAMTPPASLSGKIGKTAEQLGEYLLPAGGWEEGAARLGASVLPRAGRLAAKFATQGAETGLISAAQSGNPKSLATGGAVGALTGAAGEGIKAVAPTMAEVALGIPNRVRRYGAEPGEAILNDLTSSRPAALADEAGSHIDALDKQATAAAVASPLNGDLKPARDLIDQEIAAAQQRNSPTLLRQLNKIKSQLSNVFDAQGKPTGALPATVSAEESARCVRASTKRSRVGLRLGRSRMTR